MRTKSRYHFQDNFDFAIPDKFEEWLKLVSEEYNKPIQLQYVFCSDESLLRINQNHLQHDTYTDIITFELSDLPTRIQGEIYISVDRVNENAKVEGCSFAEELVRVMSHGVFHLLGFGDKKQHEALKMRKLEQSAIDFICDVSRETK